MKAISDAFWGFLGLLLIVACFQACDEIASENGAGAEPRPQPERARERAGCDGVIRIAAPYDIRPELDEASAIVGGAVEFAQVGSGQDVTIHNRRYEDVWARATLRGREVWMDFERVPERWRARIIVHEILHNAGYDNLSESSCDIMVTPPNWCDGRPIVRQEYVRGLQRLARCQQEQPASIQASSAPAEIVSDYAPEGE